MTKDTLIRELERRKDRLGSWKAVAESLNISPQYMSDLKDGNREPGETVLKALGLERVVSYRKATASTEETAA